MSCKLSEIASMLHSDAPSDDRIITTLLTDSRSLTFPAESLFFALTTRSGDGHRYIHELYTQGVRAFVVSYIPEEMRSVTDAHFIVVDDTTAALQAVGRGYRQLFDVPVIGITGSRGKTTVKEWLNQLLSPTYNIVRSPRSYNSQIGVPLSIWEMNADTQLAIFEAGISRPGEMEALNSIIRPNLGIITNVGVEHDEGFRSLRQKCDEKVKLLAGCDCIIYNADDRMVADAVERAAMPVKEIAWSEQDADRPLFIDSITSTDHDSTVVYTYLGERHSYVVPFISRADIENTIHCLASMLYLGISTEVIAMRMKDLQAVGTRLDVFEGINRCTIIYDSYTCDLHSLAPAIDFMHRRRTEQTSLTLIISDVMHETMPAAKLYQAVAQLVRAKGIDRVIGIGEEISAHSRYFDSSAQFYPTTAAFLKDVSGGDFDHELILIKGAPGFHFSLISDMLEARRHETVLEVNLDALIANFNYFRSSLRPTTGIVCMVKASGYGAGAYELSKTLQSQGAAYLAVAVIDEGVGLRKAGITMPIMVMNPRSFNYRTMFAYRLEPEVYSFEVLDEIIREGEKYGIEDYPIHIKFDTGMHRLGFLEDDLPQLIHELHEQKVVRPASMFSHLACADDPAEDDYTRMQFAIFDRMCHTVQQRFNHHIMRHILNSTGILRFPEQQHDLVRLGIGLYGVRTMDDELQAPLRPVSALYSTVISVKSWPAGTTIGYNRRGVLKRDSRIATIPVGYADGIDRHLGCGGMSVSVNGHRCPTVGNICMDACMIDVTDAECNVGDVVCLFGPEIPVYELASELRTIPYEVLTSVSDRVKRVYYRES